MALTAIVGCVVVVVIVVVWVVCGGADIGCSPVVIAFIPRTTCQPSNTDTPITTKNKETTPILRIVRLLRERLSLL